MTGPSSSSSSGGDPRKGQDLGGADAVPSTPSAAKRQGAEPDGVERRRTPRGATAATATSSGSGIKPLVWIVVAIVVIAVGYFALGR
jgi:hypothetical protein